LRVTSPVRAGARFSQPARRAEVRVFVEWFDRVWKRPPNAIDAELGRPTPDHIRIAALEHELRATLDVFEAMRNAPTSRRFTDEPVEVAELGAVGVTILLEA